MNDGRREVSAQVYREIVEQGLVGRLQEEVLAAVFRSAEPLTANEVGQAIGVNQRTTYAPRIVELEAMGVLEKAGKRTCTVSGKQGYTYRFTGRRPAAAPAAAPTMRCPCCDGTGRIAAPVEPAGQQDLFGGVV